MSVKSPSAAGVINAADAPEIDPITLEVVRSGLDSLADQMALTVSHTAYSGIVRDVLDFSTAFCDVTGEMIAQGLTLVCHLGSFPAAVKSVLTKFSGCIHPGDIYIMNDPYSSGGIHLPDIFIIKPVFVADRLEGFVGAVAHQIDVGGAVPGSQCTGATEIFQEGLMIPTMKLYERGEANEAVFDFLRTNVRIPYKVLGDVRAEIAAVNVGEREYKVLAGRYGPDVVRRCTRSLLDLSERIARSDIREMPDGVYSHTSYIDGDAVLDEPVVIKAEVTIEGDEITIDLTESSPQVAAGVNSPIAFTESTARGAVRTLLSADVPNAAGYFRAIHVLTKAETVVHPVLPAACAVRGITGARIMDCVLGALAQAVPERVPADGEGGNTCICIGGEAAPGDERFIYADAFAGARGGAPWGDGVEGMPHSYANIANTPVELIEHDHPLRVERYAIIPDSAGAGMHRGALSQVRSIRMLAQAGTMEIRSDKRTHLPYGLQGGSPGTPSVNILHRDGAEIVLPTLVSKQILRKDDVVVQVLAGGGGWGDPLDRDVAAVERDVQQDKITPAKASADYGVVVDQETGEADGEATAHLRARLRTERQRGAGEPGGV
ncbi:hydantoinase B/oxoprolinase family protein [Actinomadura madurae]|uniref:hydantoinase B/oxoprolinase family protein n=1 Tax=Actinomadura madurae TaxID=1993 RepID=UPI00202622C3|nr:hydantoinase B/oxoprolinase family protein [Actinomadura madurae]MCP9955681.1 hydantoinase B/oxoprolinase family protein [Actinomadura madurae]MCP9984926.1 hydantoinase B/oxoprolinase family protein [Actinomadura madurae]MCQ0003520.1 hydantoinase B/oxoprolinase family protein [Actinomadura madurae]URN03270.1 hydantoinase B/oxoprolinase family protein [Actinomadura madurae]